MKKIIITIIGVLFFELINAQVLTQYFEKTIPIKFKSNEMRGTIPVITIPPPDVKTLLEEDEIWKGMNDAPYCFGKAIKIHCTLDDGIWYPLEDGRMCELHSKSF